MGVFVIALLVGLVSQDWSASLKAASHQVVRLETRTEGESRPGLCSGVVVNTDPAIVLTAAHCVSHPLTAGFSMTVSGRHADVVLMNTVLDLAVVKFNCKDELAMTLAQSTPPIGGDVMVVGFAFGDPHLAVQFGRVAQVFNEETKRIWLNADVIFGDSGGAIVNPAGELVGLTTSIFYDGPAHLGGAIPVEALRDFLKNYLPKK